MEENVGEMIKKWIKTEEVIFHGKGQDGQGDIGSDVWPGKNRQDIFQVQGRDIRVAGDQFLVIPVGESVSQARQKNEEGYYPGQPGNQDQLLLDAHRGDYTF